MLVMLSGIVTMQHKTRRSGFTLVELMVVLVILGLLFGLIMPILQIANRASRGSASRSVMAKIDVAARLFRSEVGSYPFQLTYAELGNSVPSAPTWTNRLYYHLGTTIANADLVKIKADMKVAAGHYEFDWTMAPPDSFSFNADDFHGGGLAYPAMGNRMAAERARLMIMAGNIEGKGPTMKPRTEGAWTRRVLPTGPLVAAPQSSSRPGWAGDYLAGELESRFISGEVVLDGWKRPLIYVCQVVEGMSSAYVDHIYDRPMEGFSTLEYGLQPLGRRTLGPRDAITGRPLTSDPPSLPDLTQLRHSDRRTYAAPGHEVDFELWSAGADGRADWMRDHPANTDNVSCKPYDKRIP